MAAFTALRAGCHASGPTRLGWWFLSTALVLLAINKELDLHARLIPRLRDLCSTLGMSKALAVAVGLTSAAALLSALFWNPTLRGYWRGFDRGFRRAVMVLAVLLLVLLVRIAPGPIAAILTIHMLAREDGLWHVHLSEGLELATIGWLILGSGGVRPRPSALSR